MEAQPEVLLLSLVLHSHALASLTLVLFLSAFSSEIDLLLLLQQLLPTGVQLLGQRSKLLRREKEKNGQRYTIVLQQRSLV